MRLTGNPSRCSYSGYSGVGTVEYAIAVRNTAATIQKPAPEPAPPRRRAAVIGTAAGGWEGARSSA